MRTLAALALALCLGAAEPALAGTLSGVTLSDTTTVGSTELVLNGIGARKKYMFTVYVGALYLPAKTRDAAQAISQDVPKKLVMHFVYSGGVTRQQLIDTFNEGVSKQTPKVPIKPQWDKLFEMLEDVGTGDEIVFAYAPGKGTTVTVKGQERGVIPGKAFMVSLFTVYLGDSPPTSALKDGMLGG